MMGLKYFEDYELRFQDVVLSEEDMVLDDNIFYREPIYDPILNLYLEDDRTVGFYLNRAQNIDNILNNTHKQL